jgi:hypothetical protein
MHHPNTRYRCSADLENQLYLFRTNNQARFTITRDLLRSYKIKVSAITIAALDSKRFHHLPLPSYLRIIHHRLLFSPSTSDNTRSQQLIRLRLNKPAGSTKIHYFLRTRHQIFVTTYRKPQNTVMKAPSCFHRDFSVKVTVPRMSIACISSFPFQNDPSIS